MASTRVVERGVIASESDSRCLRMEWKHGGSARAQMVTTRIIRPGDERPADLDWLDKTMEERIAGVWE